MYQVKSLYLLASRSVSGQESIPQGIAFSSDGYKMFVVGYTGDDVNVYEFSPFDITIANLLS